MKGQYIIISFVLLTNTLILIIKYLVTQ